MWVVPADLSIAATRILLFIFFHISVGIFNARLILSFSGTHEPSAPTTSGMTVPMSAYLDFLRSDALAKFETSSNGHVTSMTICGEVMVMSGMRAPERTLREWGTSRISNRLVSICSTAS